MLAQFDLDFAKKNKKLTDPLYGGRTLVFEQGFPKNYFFDKI